MNLRDLLSLRRDHRDPYTASRGEHGDSVRLKHVVVRGDREPRREGVGDEQPIERIAMVERQRSDSQGRLERHIEYGKSRAADHLRQPTLGRMDEFKLSNRLLDGNLPP